MKDKEMKKKAKNIVKVIRDITVTRFLSTYPIDYHRWHKFKR